MNPVLENAHLFRAFEAYRFDRDERFKAGVATIVATKHSDEHVKAIDQAKFFYYSKFVTPFEYEEYARWRAGEHVSESLNNAENVQPSEDKENRTRVEPQYPTSFQDLVEMIQKGVPIPGIKHIPNELATEEPSKSTMNPRVKPWERQD